jgi:hypothetical protein
MWIVRMSEICVCLFILKCPLCATNINMFKQVFLKKIYFFGEERIILVALL